MWKGVGCLWGMGQSLLNRQERVQGVHRGWKNPVLSLLCSV